MLWLELGMPKTPDSILRCLTEFIVQLSKHLYGQLIKVVADHLLNVVRCSDDRVALAASTESNGYGVPRMKRDEHVVKVLKNTFECAKIHSSIAEGDSRQQGK
jgi:hypothetical protein